MSTASLDERLELVRRDTDVRRLAMGIGALAGLLLASVHWLGFVVGGALVALTQPTLGRGLLSGLAFGVLAWLVFVAWLAILGSVGVYAGMGELLALSVAIPVLGGLLGGLARGIV
jgi:hypothetical protein